MSERGSTADRQPYPKQIPTLKELRERFKTYLNNNKKGLIDHPLRYIPNHKLRESLEPLHQHQNLCDVVSMDVLEGGAELAKKSHLLAIKEEVTDLTNAEKDSIRIQQSKRFWHEPKELRLTLAACCLASMVQGWAQVANGNLGWTEEFSVRVSPQYDYDKGAVIRFALVQAVPWFSAAVLGSYLSDPLSEFTGRRSALFLAAFCSFASAIAGSRAESYKALLGTRVLLGLGTGGKAAIVPILESEIVSSSKRGRLLVSWQVFTATGIFLGSIACYILRNNWRNQIISTAIPAFALMLATFACCESPRWLIVRDKYQQAYSTLLQLRREPRLAAKELVSIHFQIRLERVLFLPSRSDEHEEAKMALEPWPPWVKRRAWWQRLRSMIYVPRNSRALTSAMIVMLSQNLSGISILAFLATQFYTTAGLGHSSSDFINLRMNTNMTDVHNIATGYEAESLRFSIGFGAVNMIFSSLAFFLVENKVLDTTKSDITTNDNNRQSQSGRRSNARFNDSIAITKAHNLPSNQVNGNTVHLSNEGHAGSFQKDGCTPTESQTMFQGTRTRRNRILKLFPEYRKTPKFRGRRFLLLTSLGAGVVTLFLAAMMFYIDPSNPARSRLVIFFLLVWTAFYSPGAGAIPFLYCAEIFPNEGRELGMSWSTFWNFMGAGATAMIIPFGLFWTNKPDQTAEHNRDQSLRNLLGLFSGLNAVAFILVWFCVYSTNHTTTLEEYSYVFGKRMRDHMKAQFWRLWKWDEVYEPMFKWFTSENDDAESEENQHGAHEGSNIEHIIEKALPKLPGEV